MSRLLLALLTFLLQLLLIAHFWTSMLKCIILFVVTFLAINKHDKYANAYTGNYVDVNFDIALKNRVK